MRSIAIIPARGGSKRIPGKNIRPFRGKPMIAYSIEAARAAGVFQCILVSTDSLEIAKLARELGAEAPALRPAELAGDLTATAPVIAHELRQLDQTGAAFDLVCCIYATAPFLRPADLRAGYELVASGEASSAIAVAAHPHNARRALQSDAGGRLEWMLPEYRLARSQDLAPTYYEAGQFYWARVDAFLAHESFLTGKTLPLVLPRRLVQDIDTPEDWRDAELLHELLERTEAPAA